MGLPGAGKSQFGHCLSRDASNATRQLTNTRTLVSQDEMGRRLCVDFVGRVSAAVCRGERGGIVVDCTNVSAKHRSEWLSVMHQPSRKDTALIFVDAPLDVCVARVQARVDHSSIPFGRGDRIVRGFAKQLEAPTEEERRRLFGRVEVLQTENDFVRLLRSFGTCVEYTRL